MIRFSSLAKCWFFLMLLMPLWLPIAVGALIHVYYIVFPDPEVTIRMVNDTIYYRSHTHWYQDYAGSTEIERRVHYLTEPLTGILSILKLPFGVIVQYLVFAALMIVWSARKSIKDIKKSLLLLPIVFLAVMTIYGILFFKKSDVLIVVLTWPFMGIAGYAYLGLALVMTPRRYLREPAEFETATSPR